MILFKQWRRLLLFSIRKRLQSFRRIVRRYWSVLFVIMTSFPTHSLVTRLTLLRIFCIASAVTSLLAVTSHAADDVRKWNIFIDDVTASRHYRHHALHNRWSPDHVPHATADEPADPCKAGACYPHPPNPPSLHTLPLKVVYGPSNSQTRPILIEKHKESPRNLP